MDGRADPGAEEAGAEYRDITVLYRAHYITRAVEEVFSGRKSPIPSTAACSFSAAWRLRTPSATCG